MTLSEHEVALITRQFHSFFLRGSIPEQGEGSGQNENGQKENGQNESGGGTVRRTPGPVPAYEGSLGLRHMEDPTARVLAGLYFARVFPMQALYARNADERQALNAALIRITGVEPLLRDGRLLSCVVTWSAGRWPKRPTGMRVSLPGGEAERRRLLGRFEPHLRQMAAALISFPSRHSAGHKEVGPPRR